MIDDLTPKERKKALREGRAVDRLPNLFTFEGAEAKLIGVNQFDYVTNPKVHADAVRAAFERWEPDVLEIGGGTEYDLFGIEMVIPEESNPYVKAPTDLTREQIAGVGRANPRTDSALAGLWEALESAENEYGSKGVEIGVIGPGPVTAAAQIIGLDNFLKKLLRDPEYIHFLLDKITSLREEFIRSTAGFDLFFDIKEPVSSGSLISRSNYLAFAQPYQKRIFKAMKETHPDNDHILHICGDTSKIWEDMVDTGAAVISIDNAMDLTEAKRRIGHLASISGNIKPAATMLLGTPEDVEEDYKQGLGKAWDAEKTYIPDLGCGTPICTPIENLDKLFGSHRKHSAFPIKSEATN